MSTLSQIITEINTFATTHKQISEFFEGDIFDYATGKDNDFIVLTCNILGNSVTINNLNDGGEDNFKFQIGVFDKLLSDHSNRRKCLSDTNSICKDFIAYFKNNPSLLDFEISFGDLTDYTDKTDNMLGGWFFDVSLTVYNQLDYCGIPLVVYVPANNPFVQIWYDNLVGAKPSQPLLNDLNALYNSLTGEELTLFHPIAGMETDEQRLKPIISSSGSDFTSQGSFTLDNEGFLSDGATGYLNSNWNGIDDGGIIFVIDSAAIGVFVKTSLVGTFCPFGSLNFGQLEGSFMFPNIAGFTQMQLHQDSQSLFAVSGTEKHFSIKRTDNSTVDLYTDGVFQLSDFQAQSAMTNFDLYIGARNVANFAPEYYYTQYVRGVYTGSENVNITLMNTSFNTYLTSRGL